MNASPSGRNLSGFSLLEIIVVLALITLLASLAVINLSSVYDSAHRVPTEELLAMAVKESRYRAMVEKETVYLAYNPRSFAFEVQTAGGQTLVEIPTDHDADENPLEVTFKTPRHVRGLPSGFRGNARFQYDPLPRVAFGVTLVSNPFVVELKTGESAQTYQFDPFSNVRLAGHESP